MQRSAHGAQGTQFSRSSCGTTHIWAVQGGGAAHTYMQGVPSCDQHPAKVLQHAKQLVVFCCIATVHTFCYASRPAQTHAGCPQRGRARAPLGARRPPARWRRRRRRAQAGRARPAGRRRMRARPARQPGLLPRTGGRPARQPRSRMPAGPPGKRPAHQTQLCRPCHVPSVKAEGWQGMLNLVSVRAVKAGCSSERPLT